MSRSVHNLLAYSLLTAVLFAVPIFAGNLDPSRKQDRVAMDQTIRFRRDANSAIVSRQIRRGTTHWYRVRAREGQRMQVVLTTRGKTSFTISARNAGILEDADGVKSFVGDLPETGEYLIVIGTDNTASYTLEVAIV